MCGSQRGQRWLLSFNCDCSVVTWEFLLLILPCNDFWTFWIYCHQVAVVFISVSLNYRTGIGGLSNVNRQKNALKNLFEIQISRAILSLYHHEILEICISNEYLRWFWWINHPDKFWTVFHEISRTLSLLGCVKLPWAAYFSLTGMFSVSHRWPILWAIEIIKEKKP